MEESLNAQEKSIQETRAMIQTLKNLSSPGEALLAIQKDLNAIKRVIDRLQVSSQVKQIWGGSPTTTATEPQQNWDDMLCTFKTINDLVYNENSR